MEGQQKPTKREREKGRNVRIGDDLWEGFKAAVEERGADSASSEIRSFMTRYVRETERRRGGRRGPQG